MTDVPFSCRCGAVGGTLTDAGPALAQGTRVTCHCADCRGAARWLQRDRDPDVGVGYWQTTPDRVRIERGADRLACLSWRNPKFLRWYADCCGTPLFNTPGTKGMPFASAYIDAIPDPAPLGPVRGVAFVPTPGGKPKTTGTAAFLWGLARRSLPARLSGRWTANPFFDADGRPVARPRRLTEAERRSPRMA
ncbi:DUF6151 family protein [Wenxinia marina]|uniref:CENP-V/GFA domain-containing protein n=1 Tax=Wenxinia marina DSM 24838 TaxID=1123501 RepID=A0A0D0Q1P3_9RHOB|nr:DUF6151 family protein [Wenxinia marina]KIQ68494.1 hypothetical protein Wenmar_02764 [Wenxinia marina DSM 24838]GGL66219.1 hypothetical protein GCM10011392_21040 [Wenxinia marina]